MAKKNPLPAVAPFMKGNVTRLKLLLPCSMDKAWQLVASPKGLASWFSISVKGRIALGKMIEFG